MFVRIVVIVARICCLSVVSFILEATTTVLIKTKKKQMNQPLFLEADCLLFLS